MIKTMEELLDKYQWLCKELEELHGAGCDCDPSIVRGPNCRRRLELTTELSLIENALHMSPEDIARILADGNP